MPFGFPYNLSEISVQTKDKLFMPFKETGHGCSLLQQQRGIRMSQTAGNVNTEMSMPFWGSGQGTSAVGEEADCCFDVAVKSVACA